MKYVILSGASGGLGKKTTEALIKNGYYVFGLDLINLNEENDNYHFIQCDISNKDDITRAIEIISSITKEIYAIINLAGIFKMQSIIEGSDSDLKKIMNINFFGTYYLNKIAFPLLNENSRIVNMSSEVARYSPQPFMAYYSLTKRMVSFYSDVLRRECSYIGMKVIVIEAGALKTKMLSCANEEYERMVSNTKYFSSPLKKLKGMMDNELEKTNNPIILSNTIIKILKKKNPRIRYRIKNSFALRFVNSLPLKWQDKIYKMVIK